MPDNFNPSRPVLPITFFDSLPDSAFLREANLVLDPKYPDRPSLLPWSAPTLWRAVKAREFPAPVKLARRVTAWRVSDIRKWLKERV